MKPHDLKGVRIALARRTTSFAFTKLSAFNHGAVFVGRFSGRAPWERHRHGDELVQVLDGEVDLTVLTAQRSVHVTLRAGGMFVVPRGAWHRQHARSAVTLLSATPTPTDTSLADDPRSGKRRTPAHGRSDRPPRSHAGTGRWTRRQTVR